MACVKKQRWCVKTWLVRAPVFSLEPLHVCFIHEALHAHGDTNIYVIKNIKFIFLLLLNIFMLLIKYQVTRSNICGN
jgi:hypothetical protein